MTLCAFAAANVDRLLHSKPHKLAAKPAQLPPAVPLLPSLGVPCAAELIAQDAGDMSSQQLLDLGAKVRWSHQQLLWWQHAIPTEAGVHSALLVRAGGCS